MVCHILIFLAAAGIVGLPFVSYEEGLPLLPQDSQHKNNILQRCRRETQHINTLRTGDADLRFYVTTVQDG